MEQEELPQHFLQHEEVEEYMEGDQQDEEEVVEYVEDWQEIKTNMKDGQPIDEAYAEEYFLPEYDAIYEEDEDVDVDVSPSYDMTSLHPDDYMDYNLEVRRGNSKRLTIVECDICKQIIKHPSKIQAHMRTHTGEKPFECEICGMRFTQKTPMVNHFRHHVGDTPYACRFGCGKQFVNNARKNAHELRHQGIKRLGPPRPHLKPPKRKINNDNTRLSKLMPGVRGFGDEEKSAMVDWHPPFGQIEQPMSVTSSKRLDEVIEAVASGLSLPVRKQVNSRASVIAQCHICGLMVKHPSKIQAHMRTHTGEKPYECDICGARFSLAAPLRMHMKRKHIEGERSIPCSWECGKMFVSLGARNEHERVVHAGIKRYECNAPGCRRMFARRQYLMQHREKEHPNYAPVFDPNEILEAEFNRNSREEQPSQDYYYEDEADNDNLNEMYAYSSAGPYVEEYADTAEQSTSQNEVHEEVIETEEVYDHDQQTIAHIDHVEQNNDGKEAERSKGTDNVNANGMEETVKHVWMTSNQSSQKKRISVRILKKLKKDSS